MPRHPAQCLQQAGLVFGAEQRFFRVQAKADADTANTAAKKLSDEADVENKAAAERVKRAVEKAKPKDTAIVVYSPPIQIRVTTPTEQAKSK